MKKNGSTLLRTEEALILLAVACVVAPLGDYGHVTTGATRYDWSPSPHLLRSPWWFVALVGFFAVSTGQASRLLRRLFPKEPPASFKEVCASVTGLLWTYAATSLLPRSWPAFEAIAMAGAAGFVWSVAGSATSALAVGLIGALSGVLGEVVLVRLGAFHYDSRIGTLFGVAPWLLASYFTAGVCVSRIEGHLSVRRRGL